MVFSIAYHFTRDAGIAEELAQDTFVMLYQQQNSIQSPAHLVHWLRKTIVHRCIDYSRRDRSSFRVPLDDIPEPGTKPELISNTENLHRLVASLPEDMRIVVILRFQEELEPREIASFLDMPVNTVKSRLQRALSMLRRKLEATERSVSL